MLWDQLPALCHASPNLFTTCLVSSQSGVNIVSLLRDLDCSWSNHISCHLNTGYFSYMFITDASFQMSAKNNVTIPAKCFALPSANQPVGYSSKRAPSSFRTFNPNACLFNVTLCFLLAYPLNQTMTVCFHTVLHFCNSCKLKSCFSVNFFISLTTLNVSLHPLIFTNHFCEYPWIYLQKQSFPLAQKCKGLLST